MSLLHKYRSKFRYLAILLALSILVSLGLILGLRKTVTLSVDGQSFRITTYAIKVGDFLKSQAISLSTDDELSPSQSAWLKNGVTISVIHAIPVQIFADGVIYSLNSPDRLPSSLLAQAGVKILTGDQLLSNGHLMDPNQSFPLDSQSLSIQVVRSVSFTLQVDGKTEHLNSTAATLGSALWAAGYSIYASDLLVPSADTPLTSGLSASLVRSPQVTIQTQTGLVMIRTAASTVGAALEAAHLSPQGLDYSLPELTAPIPSSGKIRLVRVTEQVLVEQTPLSFKTEYQPVSDLDLDSQSIVQAGEVGLTAQRVRVRYEDGVEVSRQVDSEWVARQPQSRIIGYGTNIVMHTTTVDGVTIQYWRELTVWVTSYHPSETGSNRTATGALVEIGVVGVNPNYIPYYTEMYIPGYGYGTALDTGNIGARWIDLGYPDDEYIPWHQYVTIYFIWPPPANVVWIIP